MRMGCPKDKDLVFRKQWRQLNQIMPVGRRMDIWCSKTQGKDAFRLSLQSVHHAAHNTEQSLPEIPLLTRSHTSAVRDSF